MWIETQPEKRKLSSQTRRRTEPQMESDCRSVELIGHKTETIKLIQPESDPRQSPHPPGSLGSCSILITDLDLQHRRRSGIILAQIMVLRVFRPHPTKSVCEIRIEDHHSEHFCCPALKWASVYHPDQKNTAGLLTASSFRTSRLGNPYLSSRFISEEHLEAIVQSNIVFVCPSKYIFLLKICCDLNE